MVGEVRVTITADATGRIDLQATGPYKGKAGLLALLDAGKDLVAQMKDDQ